MVFEALFDEVTDLVSVHGDIKSNRVLPDRLRMELGLNRFEMSDRPHQSRGRLFVEKDSCGL
jgi:hypothetical protein